MKNMEITIEMKQNLAMMALAAMLEANSYAINDIKTTVKPQHQYKQRINQLEGSIDRVLKFFYKKADADTAQFLEAKASLFYELAIIVNFVNEEDFEDMRKELDALVLKYANKNVQPQVATAATA